MATKIILPRSVVLKCDKSINMKLNKSQGGGNPVGLIHIFTSLTKNREENC